MISKKQESVSIIIMISCVRSLYYIINEKWNIEK